jgi:hypothetical protein
VHGVGGVCAWGRLIVCMGSGLRYLGAQVAVGMPVPIVPILSTLHSRCFMLLKRRHPSRCACVRAQLRPPRAAAALASHEGAAAARLSRRLVEIQTHLDLPPIQAPLESLRLRVPADQGAAALQELALLEFKAHARRVGKIWQRSGLAAGGGAH